MVDVVLDERSVFEGEVKKTILLTGRASTLHNSYSAAGTLPNQKSM